MDQDQVEKLSIAYQKLQGQLQTLSMQKEQFNIQKEELKEAHAEVEKARGKVYVTIGGIIVETAKEEAIKNIADKQELLSLRLNIVTKQHEETARKEKELREQISAMLKEQGNQ